MTNEGALTVERKSERAVLEAKRGLLRNGQIPHSFW